jgi:hypothetical protein
MKYFHVKIVNTENVQFIDLVLIDQQSVGQRSLHLMDTVNAKKRWTTSYWRVHKFLKESHIVTRHAKERASFLKINDISFFEELDGRAVSALGVRSRKLSIGLNGQS